MVGAADGCRQISHGCWCFIGVVVYGVLWSIGAMAVFVAGLESWTECEDIAAFYMHHYTVKRW